MVLQNVEAKGQVIRLVWASKIAHMKRYSIGLRNITWDSIMGLGQGLSWPEFQSCLCRHPDCLDLGKTSLVLFVDKLKVRLDDF